MDKCSVLIHVDIYGILFEFKVLKIRLNSLYIHIAHVKVADQLEDVFGDPP